jgi:hypothetical protein
MTNFHPESWNPAWTVETILLGLLSYFLSDQEKGYGVIQGTPEKRRELAAKSHAANAKDTEFQQLFPDFVHSEQLPTEPSAASTGLGTWAQAAESNPPEEVHERHVSMQDLNPEDSSSAERTDPVADRAAPLLGDRQDHHDSERGENADGNNDSEEVAECWICRDDTGEPLVHPCACTGTMSGVHASCVESWIRHHRQNAVNNEPPRCSVCHQVYRGSETRPGFGTYVRTMCWQACYHGFRVVFFTFLPLILYLFAAVVFTSLAGDAADSDTPPSRENVTIAIVCLVVYVPQQLYKLMLLAVTLPRFPHGAPPLHPCLRRFFVTDQRTVMFLYWDLITFLYVVLWVGCDGTLSWFMLVPLAPLPIVAILPCVLRCRLRRPNLDCFRNFCPRLRFCCRMLGLAMVQLLKVFVHSMHPLGSGPHFVFAMVLIVAAACQVSVNVCLILWGVHSLILICMLLEIFLVRSLTWTGHRAILWPITLVCSLESSLFADMTYYPQQDSGSTALICNTLWLTLVITVFCKVHGAAACTNTYRVWQNQHGSFRLDVSEEAGTRWNV